MLSYRPPTPSLPVRRVLIISPRFVPSNAADMHRVRQALPYLKEFGWEPTVLAVTPDEVDALQDPLLERTLPADVEIVRTSAVPIRATRAVGIGSLEARALPFLASAGRGLLERRAFDLVFFSTTAMGVTVLGPRWHRRFGVPFVVDLQDPWYSQYYAESGVAPPGGRLKYALANALSRRLEPYVLRRAAHIVSVSPAYPRTLGERYGWFSETHTTVLPFGVPQKDFEVLDAVPVKNSVFDPGDGRRHWVYAGAAGPIMEKSLTALFMALARYRDRRPDAARDLRLHFVGTTYASGDQAQLSVVPIAERCGVADLVEERPHRIPYFESLQCLLDADALIVPGSDDPGYTASKLYPYILARKPLLAVFHRDSSVVDVLRDTGAGVVVPFGSRDEPADLARQIETDWFEPEAWTAAPETDWEAFEPYTAREMTRCLADVFDGARLQPALTDE